MSTIDPVLAAALREQLRRRDAALGAGARHIGWKLGMGSRERIGDHIAIGHLTSSSVVTAGGRFRASARNELHADAELAVTLGSDLVGPAEPDAALAAISRVDAALEIVDLTPMPGEPASIVEANVWHRAVTFADVRVPMSAASKVSVIVGRELRGRARWPVDVQDRIAAATRVLDAVGERLRAGDRIITGSIVQVPVTVGDRVQAVFGDYATIGVEIVGDAGG